MKRNINKQLNIALLILGLTGIASISAMRRLKTRNSGSSSFRIVDNGKSVPILYDRDDADVVGSRLDL
jgi:hypothetical protein